MNLLSLGGCGIEGTDLKVGSGIAMGRREAGSCLFSWRNAGIVDFFVRGTGRNTQIPVFYTLTKILYCISRFGVPTNPISFFSTRYVLNIQKALLISSRRSNFLQDPTSNHKRVLPIYTMHIHIEFYRRNSLIKSELEGTLVSIQWKRLVKFSYHWHWYENGCSFRANIFMIKIGKRKYSDKATSLKSFGDDVISMRDTSRDKIGEILQTANGFHTTVKFTAEATF